MLNMDRVRAPIQRIMRLVLTALLMIIAETIEYTVPVDGESYSALSCCSIHEDKERVSRAVRVDRMIQCVNSSSAYTRTIQDESVVYAMFASPEVYSYAAHATMVNGAFFEYKGYAARLLSAETGDDFYPKDRRWNKVKAVARALNEGSGWASKTKALVSIDTDLIVLDWDLSVEEILDSHPHADLILSADALDIGNTGFLIIRNTAWAVSFFEEWWDSRFMKHTFCDQHVLNKLYASLKKKGEAQKVAILDSTTVNSRWPAIETMEKEDRVLHLMGETVPYRAAVATHASSVTCSAYRQFQTEGGYIGSDGAAPIDLKEFYDSYLPSQLAFSQARLVQLARGALAAEREEQRRRAASPLAKETDIQRLHAANTNACDDKRPYLSNSHAECEGFFQQEYQLIRAALRAQSSVVGQEGVGDDMGDFEGVEGVETVQIEQIEGEMAASNRSSTYKMFLMDHLAKTLYNVVFFSPRERKRAAAARVLSALQSMKKEVDMNNPVNQIYLLHKEALIHSQLASYYYSIEDWGTCLDDSRVAINAITDVLAICEEKSPDFAGYVLEYVDMASQASEAFFHVQQYEEALEWAQAALKNAEVLFNTFRGEERVIARDLARLHSLMAKMLIYNPQVEKYLDLAEKQLKLARMSKLTFDVEHALPTQIKDDLIELSEMIVKKRKEEATPNI